LDLFENKQWYRLLKVLIRELKRIGFLSLKIILK
jgi:hypothetical protein